MPSCRQIEPGTSTWGRHFRHFLLLVRRIPRQGVRVSRVGVELHAILRARYFPIPNQSCVVGKKLALTGDHLLDKHGRPACVDRKGSSLADIPLLLSTSAKITAFQAV